MPASSYRLFSALLLGLCLLGSLTGCGPAPSANPSPSPSSSANPSPAPSSSTSAATKVWTDAEYDAAVACFAASSNASAQLLASTSKFQVGVLRGNRNLLGPVKYQEGLNNMGQAMVNGEATFKLGCVK